jgi:PKD repeat protein
MTGIRIGITFFVLFIFNTAFACTDTYSSIADSACGTYGSPSGNYWWNNSGTYTDTIPNMAGCDSIITLEITIHPIPIVDFMVNNSVGCSPIHPSFTNLSDRSNLSFTWDFGDGTTSHVSNEQVWHTYAVPGTYEVSLTATSEFGCLATRGTSDFIIVYPIPNIDVDIQVDNCEKEVTLSINLDSNHDVSWTLPNDSIIYSGNSITSIQEGTYSIMIFLNTSYNLFCINEDTFEVTFDFCEKPGGIKLFPNPSSVVININNVQPNSTVSVIALNGHVYDVGITDENGELVVDLRFLPEGIYYIQINTAGNFRYKKVLIIRPK